MIKPQAKATKATLVMKTPRYIKIEKLKNRDTANLPTTMLRF
jgi:hypothetical protein